MPQRPNGINLVILGIVCFYLALKLGIGVYHKRRSERNLESFAVADRKVPGFLLGLRLGATNTAGGAVIGAVGLSWITGVSMIWYFIALAAGTVVYAMLLSGQFRISRAITPSQWFGQKYGGSTWTITTVACALNCFVFLILQITSATIGMHYILGFSTLESVFLIAGVFVLYTLLGGFSSVMWTDILSYTITILAYLAIVVLAMSKFGGGLATLPAHYHDFGYLGVVAAISYFIVGLSWGANVVTLQTSAAARDPRAARSLGLWAALWMALPAGLFPLAGMLARSAFPHLSSANLAMPEITVASVPPWLQGIALAGIIGASMSAGAGQLLSFSNVMVVDIVQRVRPQLSAKGGVTWSRVSVLVVGVATMLISLEWGQLPPTVISISLLGSSLALTYLVPLFAGLRWEIRKFDMQVIIVAGIITAIGYTAASLVLNFSIASGAVLPTLGVSVVLTILLPLIHRRTRPRLMAQSLSQSSQDLS